MNTRQENIFWISPKRKSLCKLDLPILLKFLRIWRSLSFTYSFKWTNPSVIWKRFAIEVGEHQREVKETRNGLLSRAEQKAQYANDLQKKKRKRKTFCNSILSLLRFFRSCWFLGSKRWVFFSLSKWSGRCKLRLLRMKVSTPSFRHARCTCILWIDILGSKNTESDYYLLYVIVSD